MTPPTSTPTGRIALASALTVALIAGALVVTVVSYRSAVHARELAEAAIEDGAAARSAEKYLARERESVSDLVLGSNPQGAELSQQRGQLRKELSHVGRGQPAEQRLARAALRANDELFTIFAAGASGARESPATFRRLDTRLDSWEQGVLQPLRVLRSVNDAEQLHLEASADRSSLRALLFAIFAGALAIAGGLCFGWYAVRLVRQIAVRNQQLRELDRMKDDFVAAVSHELRTPLTSIRGYLDLLLEEEAGELTEEQHHFLSVVARNADRLMRVAGDLLFVAQVEAGTLSLEREPADLEELAREAVDAAGPAATEKQVELELDLAGSCDVDGDRARLAQVLDNLISNAVKFTPGGGHVMVRTIRRGDAVTVEVADDGMGMSEADLEHVFQRFFRASAATEQAIQGTGLGLSIVKAIVEGHGGTITVTSSPGRGTTFRVDLPLLRERAQVAA